MENDSLLSQRENLRRNQRDRFRTTALMYSGEINKTESDFRNTLYTIASFLFTFSSPIFVDIENLDESTKVLLFISWIFLLSSICFGFWQTSIELDYYKKIVKRESEAESLWVQVNPSQQEYDDAVKETERLYKDHQRHSWMLPQILQVIFLVIGFVLLISCATILLFK
jgi:hypothetical protein